MGDSLPSPGWNAEAGRRSEGASIDEPRAPAGLGQAIQWRQLTIAKPLESVSKKMREEVAHRRQLQMESQQALLLAQQEQDQSRPTLVVKPLLNQSNVSYHRSQYTLSKFRGPGMRAHKSSDLSLHAAQQPEQPAQQPGPF